MSDTTNNKLRCSRCGREVENYYGVVGNPLCNECSFLSFLPAMPGCGDMGWRCPNCGRGNSPYVKQCDCHPNVHINTVTF